VLVLSVVAQIVRVLMDQMGAGVRCPARRRLELTARAAAPVRAVASSSSGQGLCCAVAHVGAARVQRQVRRSAHGRRAGPVRPGAWGAVAGWPLPALSAYGGIGPPERTGSRLACSRAASSSALPGAAGIGCVTLADYVK
jgi:hypothetical protein